MFGFFLNFCFSHKRFIHVERIHVPGYFRWCMNYDSFLFTFLIHSVLHFSRRRFWKTNILRFFVSLFLAKTMVEIGYSFVHHNSHHGFIHVERKAVSGFFSLVHEFRFIFDYNFRCSYFHLVDLVILHYGGI